jgi:peptide/nickel transport system substrate-binding protein
MRSITAIVRLVAIAGSLIAASAHAQTPGGRLNMVINPEPPTLILALNLQAPTQTVAGKIYEGLLSFSEDLKPQARLAKSWTVSSDGMTYTFKLQENVKWHDGQPFSSADVAFSLGKMLPETNPIARTALSQVESIDTPDSSTVVIKLKAPDNAFLTALAVNTAPMMPKHIYDGSNYRTNPANSTPIGTGPFKLQEWKKGEYILLSKNKDYWNTGKPYLDEVLFKVIPDEAARLNALERGDVDVTSFTDIEPVEIERISQDKKLNITYDGYEYFSPLLWIEINNRIKPLDDKRFRQALIYAIDRKFIANAIYFGSARPATSPIASTTPLYDPKVPVYPFDPKKAESLLEEMGLKKDASGIRSRVHLLVPAYGASLSRVGEYLKQALGKVGIQVTLENLDGGAWGQRTSQWDYELSLDYVYQLGHPAIGVSRTYISSNIRKVLFANTMGYSNPRVDELFAKAATSTDPEVTKKLYSEVQRILIEDAPLAWLVELRFPTITSKRVHDVVMTAHGVNDNFDSAYVDQK